MNYILRSLFGTFCRLLLLSLTIGSGLAETVATANNDHRLWYNQSAVKWTEALPIGNGRMGAMVFGGVVDERIQFNEDTLWTGHPHDYARPDAHTYLPEIRRLIAIGQGAEAAKLVREKFLSVPLRQKAYQPFGDVRLHFGGHEVATNYHRELDLEQAVARVSYTVGEVNYTREIFASYPARAIVMRISADQKGAISFKLKLNSPHKDSRTNAVSADTLALSGRVEEGGLRFESRLRVFAEGGRTTINDNGASVEKADSVTLVLVAATSFKNFEDITADPAERCASDFARLQGRDYNNLLHEHMADYRALYGRVKFDLGRSSKADQPTDRRVAQLKTDGLEADPALASLYFQYGRYLLISSSRPGSRPANLQGIWNEELSPPWESKWTTNINAEMNYWLAEVTNLSECHRPLFDLTEDVAISGARTAKAQYDCGGWVLHHNTDLWCGTAPINNIDGVWPTGGAWLCQHLWEHYLFTGDKGFLANRAYPLLKGASQFFVDYLVKDQKTGWLVTSPSFSPEQGGLCAGPTMDNQLVRSLFRATRQTARILGVDADFAANLERVEAQLPPNQIGQYGQLQEWLEDVDAPNNNHRHLSPLWALYPGNDITPDDAKVFAAAKKLLAWRGEGSTGWSYAWRIPLWARAGDGDFAYRQFGQLLARKTLPNLFDLCGPFQIDGNFGAPAGVAEMLMQSYRRRNGPDGPVVIDLLPALPKVWGDGSVTGLCARGGFEVDLSWESGRLREVVLRSKLGQPCVLRTGNHELALQIGAGQSMRLDCDLNHKE